MWICMIQVIVCSICQGPSSLAFRDHPKMQKKKIVLENKWREVGQGNWTGARCVSAIIVINSMRIVSSTLPYKCGFWQLMKNTYSSLRSYLHVQGLIIINWRGGRHGHILLLSNSPKFTCSLYTHIIQCTHYNLTWV